MWRRARATIFFVFAAGATLGVGACEQILNVDGVVIIGLGPDGGPSLSVCKRDQFHCEGVALQLCDVETGAFRTVRVCSTAELCCDDPNECGDQPGCRAPSCAPGDFRCSGAALELCNAGQTGWTQVDLCPSPSQCNASLGHCADEPCGALGREYQCNNASLQQCAPGLGAWTLSEECSTHALCSANSNAFGCGQTGCRIGTTLVPNPFQCMDGDLMRCNDAQTGFEYVETCLNTANCNALIEELVGTPYTQYLTPAELEKLGCNPPSCTPGRFRCDGASLRRCNANRTGYIDLAATCQSPRHCDASAGICQPVPCTVNTTQCSGNEFQVCTPAGWQVNDRCSSGAQCDTRLGCQPAACEPNGYRCNGADLVRCNVDRTGWIPVRACATEGLCNVAAKRCDPPLCLPGQRRCFGARLEQCNPSRDGWQLIADCAAATPGVEGSPSALCDPSVDGGCQAVPGCPTGALRCNGQSLERCRDNAWRPYRRCTTAALCDASGAGSCQPPVCQPGTHRCIISEVNPVLPEAGASRAGLTLQACNAGGTGYELVRACTPDQLCDATHGQCDLCDPTQPYLCSGNELLVCTADGQERTLDKLCADACVAPGTSDGGPRPLTRATCREDLPGSQN